MNELHAYAPTGLTLYAVLIDASGQAWNGSAFEAISGAAWASYDIPLTEAAAGIYLATMPAVAAGVYSYVVYERAGGSPATSDAIRGSGWLAWDGSAEIVPASADVLDARLSDLATALLSGLSGATVTVVAPVASGGGATVYQGDDYAGVDGRALEWTATTWPDLTGAAILFMVRAQTGALFTQGGVVQAAGGAMQAVRVELTAEETAMLAAWPVESELRIRATLASGGKATLVDSTLSVIEDVT